MGWPSLSSVSRFSTKSRLVDDVHEVARLGDAPEHFAQAHGQFRTGKALAPVKFTQIEVAAFAVMLVEPRKGRDHQALVAVIPVGIKLRCRVQRQPALLLRSGSAGACKKPRASTPASPDHSPAERGRRSAHTTGKCRTKRRNISMPQRAFCRLLRSKSRSAESVFEMRIPTSLRSVLLPVWWLTISIDRAARTCPGRACSHS